MLIKILNALKKEDFYWTIGFYSLIISVFAHLSFLFLFLYLDVLPLAMMNVLSVFLYLYCIFGLGLKTIETKNDKLIGWYVYFELLYHGILATYYLGLESGFYYYTYALVFLPFFTDSYTRSIYVFRTIFVIIVSVALNIWGSEHEAMYTLSSNTLYILNIANLMTFLLMVNLISYLFIFNTEIYKKKLIKQSNTDYLTDLYNRRFIISEAEKKIIQGNHRFSILMIDIDFFKQVNDTYGHQCGDEILINISKIFLENVDADNAYIGRWGGEEFIILLLDTHSEKLKEIAERLRKAVESTLFTYHNKKDIQVTVTIGGTARMPEDTFDSLLRRTDKALYKGKENGRNQSIIV